MSYRERSVWPIFKAMLLFIAISLVWGNAGLPLVLGIASSTPEEIVTFIWAVTACVFALIIAVRVVIYLVGTVVDVVGTRTRPVGAAVAGRTARMAARALCGPEAGEAEIQTKAREIEAGWDGDGLKYDESCRHEAAHAIMAHHFGAIVLEAQVRADGSGNVGWAMPSPRPTARDESWMRICIAVAGNVMDHLDGRHNTGSSADMQQLTDSVAALLSLGEAPPACAALSFDGIVTAARDHARTILLNRNSDVDQLARLIHDHGYLHGYTVNEALKASQRTGE